MTNPQLSMQALRKLDIKGWTSIALRGNSIVLTIHPPAPPT